MEQTRERGSGAGPPCGSWISSISHFITVIPKVSSSCHWELGIPSLVVTLRVMAPAVAKEDKKLKEGVEAEGIKQQEENSEVSGDRALVYAQHCCRSLTNGQHVMRHFESVLGSFFFVSTSMIQSKL